MHKILYLGLHVPENLKNDNVTHYPVIKIIPKQPDAPIESCFLNMQKHTGLIFTSKVGVELFIHFFDLYNQNHENLKKMHIVAVGTKTAEAIIKAGLHVNLVAKEESAEGIIAEFEKIDLKDDFYFWPHSALSRPIITNYFKQRGLKLAECILYDTILNKPSDQIPNLAEFNEIVFTSPSTVDGFLKLFTKIPSDKTLTCIGPVTKAHLDKKMD